MIVLGLHGYRSREARATAEQEFLSSTSDEVCELWSGSGVVRVADKPEYRMKDLLIVEIERPKGDLQGSHEILPQVIDVLKGHSLGLLELTSSKVRDLHLQTLEKFGIEDPCIALNIQGAIITSREMRFWTIIGVIAQAFALAFPALATYHWKWTRKDRPIPSFAYLFFVSGTIAVILGLLGCAQIVEASTTKTTSQPTADGEKRIQRIIRFQRDCTVNGQHFPAFAILNVAENKLIRRSRLNDGKFK